VLSVVMYEPYKFSHVSYSRIVMSSVSGRGAIYMLALIVIIKMTRVKCNFPPFLFILLFINLLYQ